MRKLLRPLWVVLALAFLLEAWLWDHLKPIVARLVDLVPWTRLRARLVTAIKGLSPVATLALFLIPFVLLFPIKVLELWLLAHRKWLSGAALLVLAKLIGLGVTAFIFEVTREKVLQIPWFRRLYDTVIWLRDWAHEIVDPINLRIKRWLRILSPARTGRAFRLLMRLRRRVRAGGFVGKPS
jgi:hypothetical protein